MISRATAFFSPIFALLCVAGSLASAQYQPKSLMGAGYSDRQLAPNRWRVRAFSPDKIDQHAINTALYRSAILAKHAGYGHFQLVDSSVKLTHGEKVYNQLAYVTIVGTNTPEVAIACEAKPEWQSNCRLLKVDDVLSRIAISLARNPDVDLAAERTEGR